ncbi:hypothetical protein [Streptomyces sp. HYC2]|uniref:hypothetical protein n=1 Tax=Streptomyces sp. HYC2 TaxID=2955207 RepID=UPI0032B05F2C
MRIEQTRRRLAKLRAEGLVDRITMPQRGRLRVWFPTQCGVQVACEWSELRRRRPSKTVSDRTAARLRVGHALTVTETEVLQQVATSCTDPVGSGPTAATDSSDTVRFPSVTARGPRV